jgi:hypothetical protein
VTAAWVAAGAAVVVALVAAKPLHWIIKLLLGTHEFIRDWPKMKADIAELQAEVAHVKAETMPNGGSSMRDILYRTAEDVAQIKDRQAQIQAQIEVRNTPGARKQGS